MKEYSRRVLESMLDSHRRYLRRLLGRNPWPSTLWSDEFDEVMATLGRITAVKKQLSKVKPEQLHLGPRPE